MKTEKLPSHLKRRGYLHLTPKHGLTNEQIIAKVKDKTFIANHDFFPLIHTNIKERRYKQIVANDAYIRTHSYVDVKGRNKHNAKIRPLHYATHIDAMIFGYYAEELKDRYEEVLEKEPEVSACITAYRKILHKSRDRNKSTIDFAKEVFDEIKARAATEKCVVLTFDLEKFFSSLSHKHLKIAWSTLLGGTTLPVDHYNVFKACTNFSYVLLDDLRIGKSKNGKLLGFNEQKIAQSRSKGIESYFENLHELREKIKTKELPVYKNPFRDTYKDEDLFHCRKNNDTRKKIPKGIPQGLPISAVLANLYLLDFDRNIHKDLVVEQKVFYRRYSDDIVIICTSDNYLEVEKRVTAAIKKCGVKISTDKTERFEFKKDAIGNINAKKYCKVKKRLVPSPLVYLGFEFYGHKTLIKSANLAKFYRRMISTVKLKAKRIKNLDQPNPEHPPVLFKRKIHRLYSAYGKKPKRDHSRISVLKKNSTGEFRFTKVNPKKARFTRGNYLSYVERASEQMQEPRIKRQIRNHWKILQTAIKIHINNKPLGS